MKVLSLFSGIGGFDEGFERAGMSIDSVCDVDKYALGVLKRHFPFAKQYDDVRKIGEKTHERGSVDVICGGFPCQDVSIAGKRKGIAGERSGLWFEFARVIDELKPKWVVIENVAGLLSSNKGRDMETIVRSLVEFGYGVCWRVLDAQYFGIAQRRRRVFIVASLGNGRAAEVLFEREGIRWDTPSRRKTGKGIANTFTVRSGKSGGGKDVIDGLLNDQGGVVMGLENGEVSPTLRKETKGHLPVIWHNHQQDGSVRIQKDISPTVSKHWGTGGNNVPFVGVRRLTPLECEKLQGFPSFWTEHLVKDGELVLQSDTQRYKQLGNAVAVPVAEWIGKRIIGVSDD